MLIHLWFYCASQVVLVVKNLPASLGDKKCGFDPWVQKILWRRKWQPTPVFLPGQSHGERGLVGHRPWGHKRVRWDLENEQQQFSGLCRILSVQFSSVAQSCLTLCDPMNRSTPGLPVHHQLPQFTQTHVHWVSDAIQPSHPLSSPSPPASNPSQHQSLFQWVNSSHEVAKVFEFQLEHQYFQWTPRTGLL